MRHPDHHRDGSQLRTWGRIRPPACTAPGATLVLVARREDRLQLLASELTRDHGISVTIITRDLGAPDAGRSRRAELESRGIFATGLVNNVGFGTHKSLRSGRSDRLQELVALNIGALVDLSHAYFDSFKAKEPAVLINVASLLGFLRSQCLSVYGASKAFVLSFTESLWEEARVPACASSPSHPVRWEPSSLLQRAVKRRAN
ncbi:SDR family NAD(P)-dependent oxidoreductase [Arthrobacter sp. UYEF21]|uniref:SDR family NAD(P)-dependent oxidoreductase n=1 Tax=Arthrobacter sp. UYEF21 TaxID=1756364 RepID=UPI003391812E